MMAGCCSVRHNVYTPVPLSSVRGVVLAADGAGNFQSTSEALREAVACTGQPLYVDAFEWSHGLGRIIRDQVDEPHAREEGRRLACKVLAYRRNCPGTEIYLVGHSAGTAVVLAAAENLPPGSVDRIILLAPSVSADYDLRPALRCAQGGVDVFYSERDIWLLGLAVGILGTADRQWTAAAGRVGFHPVICGPEDSCLYGKLRQHRWDPCVGWTGNTGGHFGPYQAVYLRAYVIPLLSRTTCSAPPAAVLH